MVRLLLMWQGLKKLMETNRAIVWMFGLAAAAAHAVKGALTHISMNHWSNFSQVKQFFTWNMQAYGWPGFEPTTSCLARTSGAELGLFRWCQLTSMILGKISEEFALFMYGVDNVMIWSWPRCLRLLARPLQPITWYRYSERTSPISFFGRRLSIL